VRLGLTSAASRDPAISVPGPKHDIRINDRFGWAVGAGGTIDAYGCRTAGLTLTPPGSVTLPTITLNGLDQTTTTTASLTVDDETATGAGWNITQSATQFTTSGGKTLPATALSLTSTSATPAT
jgi:hypothetical protein